ncbi:MAG: DUF4279 domain-containing protein [Hyphomonas sp.]|nr:DUF4279 domain-containing protein [Hyphomonas sp.]
MSTSQPLPTIRASIVVSQFEDNPAQVSAYLGLKPTRCGKKGDGYRNVLGAETGRIIQESYWSLHSNVGPRAPLSAHIKDILAQTSVATEKFAALSQRSRITLRVTVIPDGTLPLLEVDGDLLVGLAKLQCALAIDIVSVQARE